MKSSGAFARARHGDGNLDDQDEKEPDEGVLGFFSGLYWALLLAVILGGLFWLWVR